MTQAPDETSVAPDPGMARAGAAAAARRRELDISQRRLAAEGIINAGALIAFEKGRSWPRERTRARLEEILRWPAGTISRLRYGEPPTPRVDGAASVDDAATLIAEAVTAGVGTLGGAHDSLPPIDDPAFTPRVTALLADLRQLEAVAARAARLNPMTPPLIRALSAVRRRIDELAVLGASAPGAPLGQRLYAARRRANLTIRETAQAANVSEDTITRAEADEPVTGGAVEAIETLLRLLD